MSVDVLGRVQVHVLERNVPVPGWRASQEERRRFQAAVAQAMVELRLDREVDDQLAAAAGRLARMMTGVGVLQPLLEEPGVEEVIVRDGWVQVERRGIVADVGGLADDGHFEAIARRAADLGHRTLKGDRPYVLVDLPSGDRFTAIIPPLSVRGTAINVRVFSRHALSLRDLADMNTFVPPGRTDEPGARALLDASGEEGLDLLPPVARLLARVAAGNLATVLISGEFGAGKTTLLNAMGLCVPSWVQLAVVETFEELQVAHPHPLRVVVPEGRSDYPTMDEVLNVVVTRMRPDLLVIGEVVREEAPRFLDAINLGKRAWSTIHGNDALGALYRLETKALATGLPHRAIREQIAAGVDLVVHLRKDPTTGRRFVAQVVSVLGLDDEGRYRLEPVYQVDGESRATLWSLWQEIAA